MGEHWGPSILGDEASEQRVASRVLGPCGEAFEPAGRGDGASQADEYLRDADGILPGQVLGDPVRDQGVAEPSAEGFGGRPSKTWLI